MSKLLGISLLLSVLVLFGATGLVLIEDASWFDAFYMAMITLTTVGFEEVIELSDSGRLFLITYLVLGLGVFTYGLSALGQTIVSLQLKPVMERRRMQKRLDAVENHFIICGRGRMGLAIAEYLESRNKPFVIIDNDPLVLEEVCEQRGWLAVEGDATDDETLLKARIREAKSLATVLATDADNVYVTLTARMLCKEIQIIARASDAKAVVKLERAGATRVVSPFSSGAVRMARFMLNPSIEDFLEVTGSQNDLELADFLIPEGSPYIGKRLNETAMRDLGVIVLGIQRTNGDRLLPPPGSAQLEAGDSLFAFGDTKGINTLVEKLQPAEEAG